MHFHLTDENAVRSIGLRNGRTVARKDIDGARCSLLGCLHAQFSQMFSFHFCGFPCHGGHSDVQEIFVSRDGQVLDDFLALSKGDLVSIDDGRWVNSLCEKVFRLLQQFSGLDNG